MFKKVYTITAITILLLSFTIKRTSFATTNHTITIDASLADWSEDEKLGTSFGQFYFTWDANNFYFAYDRGGSFTADPDVIFIYISTHSPTSTWGTFNSINWNGTHTLPFRAGYVYIFRPNDEYKTYRSWAGSDWSTDWAGSAATSQIYGSGIVEIRIPRSDIGNPSSIRVTMFITNGSNNWVFGTTPRENPNGATGRVMGLSWYYPNATASGVFPNLIRYRYPGVVIADVSPNAGASGNDYVTLFNPNDEAIYLSNLQSHHGLPTGLVYRLRTYNGSAGTNKTLTVVSTNTITSRGFILLAAGTPPKTADVTFAAGLDTADDGLIIAYSTTTTFGTDMWTLTDRLGWGTQAEALEGTACTNPGTADSFQRKAWSTTASSASMRMDGDDAYAGHFYDTHNNSLDFTTLISSYISFNSSDPREGFLGNCWHIPDNTSDLSGTPMRNPYTGIYKNTVVYVYNGNQYTGSGNPGDQSALTLYYKGATDSSWSSVSGVYDTTSGNNKYWKANFTNSWTRGTTVQYYLKVDYADSHDPTYLFWQYSKSRRCYEVFIATTNPYSFVVLNTTPTVPGLTYPLGGEIIIYNTSVNITWNNSTDADGDALKYIIELSTDNGTTWSVLTDTPTASPYGWVPTIEQISNQCFIRIRSTDTYSVSSSSQSQIFTISSGNESPNTPSALAQFTTSGAAWSTGDWKNYQQIVTTFTLTDPDSSDQVRFNIQFSTYPDFSYNFISATSAFTSQGATNYITPLLPEGTWYWRVRCGDNSGASNDWNYSYSSITVVNDRHFGIDISAPIISSPTLSRSNIADIGVDLLWSVGIDTYSGVNYYSIYRATYDFTSTSGTNVTFVGNLTNATTHQDTSGLSANTTYFYRLTATDNAGNTSSLSASAQIRTARIKIDGTFTDWSVSATPTIDNSATVTSVTTKGAKFNEWIWKDKLWERRSDPGADLGNYDLAALHITADEEYIYFYVRYQDITDKNKVYFAIAIDTDTVDNRGLDWIGDDSATKLSGGALNNDSYDSFRMGAEKQIIVHKVASGDAGPKIEIYPSPSGEWQAPGGAGEGANNCNDSAGGEGEDGIEFKVLRSDFGLEGDKKARFAAAIFQNNESAYPDNWADNANTTVDYNISDALDAMSIVRLSTGTSSTSVYNGSGGMSSWEEDISDGDIDFWVHVQFSSSDIKSNTIPTTPSNLSPADGAAVNTLTPQFTWTASNDSDTNDAVTSYMLEISNTSDFSSNILWRVNVPGTSFTVPAGFLDQGQLYWRLYARDRTGALSAPTAAQGFTVDTSPPVIKYNTPSVYGSTMPAAGSAQGVNGNYYVTDPGNTIDIDFLNLSVGTKTITIDGNPSDWTGTPHSTIHGSAVRDGEWIYTGDINDERELWGNPDATINVDLTEVRATIDNSNLYILIKSSDINDINKVHWAVGIDTDGDYTNGIDKIGDDTRGSLTGAIPLARGYSYSDYQFLLRCADAGSPTIEKWNGTAWQAPSSYAISISSENNCTEARISFADLGNLTPPKTIRLVIAGFVNNNGWANLTDTTWNDTVDNIDAIDGLGGDFGQSQNYWGREVSANDIDIGRNYDIRIKGEKSNIATIDYRVNGGAWQNLATNISSDYTSNWDPWSYATDSSTGCVIDIRAYDAGGNSITHLWSFHYWKGGPPDKVTDLLALTGDLPGEIKLSWTAPGDDGYVGNISGGKYRIKWATYTEITDWETGTWNDYASKYSFEFSTNAVVSQRNGRTITGLTEGVTYYFRIWTRDENENNWSPISAGATIWARIDDIPPAPVTNLSALCASDGTGIVTLNWTAPTEDGSGAGGMISTYEIRYATWDFTNNWEGGTQWTIGVPTGTTPGKTQSLRIISLANNTTYYFHIKSTDDKGNVSPLDTGTTAQVLVRHIVISEIQTDGANAGDEFVELYNPLDNSVDLSWLKLFRRNSSGTDVALPAITWITSSVIPSKGYSLLVGTSTGNSYRGSMPPDGTYSIATNNIVADGAVYLSTQTTTAPIWSDNPGPWGYVAVDLVGLGNQPSGGFETQTSTSPAANRSVERRALSGADPTTSPGIIQGNSCDTNNNSNDFVYTSASDPQNSLSSREPDISPPSAISNLTALTGSANDGDVRLEWTAPYDDWDLPYTQNKLGYPVAAAYWIKYSTSNIADFDNPPYPTYEWYVSTANVTPLSYQGFTITGLNPGTTYYFAIKTKDDSGNWSSWSTSGANTANRNFAYDAPPSPPTVNVTTVSSYTITISWSNNPPTYVDDLDKVKIYYATYSFTSETNPNTTYYGIFTKTDTPKTLTGLADWTTYFIRLKSVDLGDQGNGLWSFPLESTTLSTAVSTRTLDGTPPALINNLSALTGAANGEIWLNWTAPSDNNSVSYYDIRYRTTGEIVTEGDWSSATQIANEPAPASPGTQQWLLVTGLIQDVTYYFKIKSTDVSGNTSGLSNNAFTYAQSSGAILINEIAPSGGNFVEFLVVKPGCFRGINFYGRAGGDLTSISTTSINGVWSNIIPAGTFIVLNCTTTGADETTITNGVINIYKNVSLTATDNNFILSNFYGIDYTGGVYVSGTVIDYVIFENQDTTRDSKVISTMKSMISRNEWSSIVDTSIYDPTAFDAATSRNLSTSPDKSLARNTPTADTQSKYDWTLQTKSTGAANSASTAYAGYGALSALPEVILPDQVIIATFTYYGTSGAGDFANDDLRHTLAIDIPSGWSAPQTDNPSLLGFTTNTFSLTSGYSITISTLASGGGWRLSIPMGDLTSGYSYKITYYGKAPSTEQTYTFTARTDYKGVNVAEIGSSSQPYIIVDGTPPGAVTNLSAILTGDLSITLYWTAPGNNNYTGILDTGTKFHIATTTVLSDALNDAYWSTAKRDSAEIQISTSGLAPGISLSSGPYVLTEGSTYYFRLWTKDRAGNWSAVSNGATAYCTATPPAAINNLVATPTNVGTIDLSWNATGDDGYSQDITGGAYAIQRSTWANFTQIVWSTSNAQVVFSTNVSAGSSQSYRDYGLQIGVTYYYRIWLRDENNLGWSPLSNGATAVALRTVSDGGAFVVYYDSSSYQSPVWRGWMNGFFSSEITLDNSGAAAPGLDGNFASAASPTKNESIFLVSGNRTSSYRGLWAYVHNGSTWTYLNLTPAPSYTDTTVGTVRRFDIAYEQISGRAIAVYRNQNISTTQPFYRIFSNGSWGSETNTNLDFGSAIHWIKLYPKPQTNEIILVALLDNYNIVTAQWDGNSWSMGTTLPFASGGTNQQTFDGVYDSVWKRFILVASSRAVNGAVQYTIWDSTSWTTPQQFTFNTGGAPLSANDVRWIKLAAHPSTNEILMAVADGDSTGPNIGAAVWDGTAWSQYSTALAANSGGGVGDRPFDVSYSRSSGKGLIVYGKSSVAGRPYYITYDGSWSGENYFDSSLSANIRRVSLQALESSDDILCLFNDSDGKIASSGWNGSSWSPTVVIESTSSTRESFASSYRYDQRAIQDTTPPGNISTLTGMVLGDGEVQLTWTAPGDDNFTGALKCGSRYLFVYSTATPTDSELSWPATYWTIISTYAANPGDNQQKIISNLPYETTWYFRIKTRDEAGNWSALSNAATVFVLVTPGMITDLSAATGIRGRTIELNWTAPGDDGYIGTLTEGSAFAIQRSTWSDVVWSTGSVDTIIISTQNVNPGERQYYTLTGLDSGALYYIAIWTRDDMGNWSIRSSTTSTSAQVVVLSVYVLDVSTYNFGALSTQISTVSVSGIVIRNDGNVNETYSLRVTTGTSWPAATIWQSSTTTGNNQFVLYGIFKDTQPHSGNFGENPGNDIITLDNQKASLSNFSDGTHQGAGIEPYVISPLLSDTTIWFKLKTPIATSTTDYQTIPVTFTAEETYP